MVALSMEFVFIVLIVTIKDLLKISSGIIMFGETIELKQISNASDLTRILRKI